MEKEMMEVFGKKVEHKIKEIDKWRTNNCRAVEDENKEVENLREELQLQRESFERENSHLSPFWSLPQVTLSILPRLQGLLERKNCSVLDWEALNSKQMIQSRTKYKR